MDENTVLERLKTLHREIELDCGKDPALVTDDVQPLDGLGGFDSPLIPTIVRQLAHEIVYCHLKGKLASKTRYISADRTKKLPIRDVAKAVL